MEPIPPLSEARLSDLPSSWWMDLSCGACGPQRARSVSLVGLVTRAGPQARLMDVARRCCCLHCGARPPIVRAVLADAPAFPSGDAYVMPATFAVLLIGDDPGALPLS